MRFSIIIPAHNSEMLLKIALRSIIRQAFPRDAFEIIVVCDACQDNTALTAWEYRADKIVYTDFGRDGLARNAGLEVAEGEYVLFMDDDDWWLHDYVLQLLDSRIRAKNDPDLIVFGFLWKGIGYAGPVREEKGRATLIWPNVWSKCWKRSFIGETRFTDVKMESDLHFVNAMLEKSSGKIDLWDTPMYFYNYMRPGSQTEEASR